MEETLGYKKYEKNFGTISLLLLIASTIKTISYVAIWFIPFININVFNSKTTLSVTKISISLFDFIRLIIQNDLGNVDLTKIIDVKSGVAFVCLWAFMVIFATTTGGVGNYNCSESAFDEYNYIKDTTKKSKLTWKVCIRGVIIVSIGIIGAIITSIIINKKLPIINVDFIFIPFTLLVISKWILQLIATKKYNSVKKLIEQEK